MEFRTNKFYVISYFIITKSTNEVERFAVINLISIFCYCIKLKHVDFNDFLNYNLRKLRVTSAWTSVFSLPRNTLGCFRKTFRID